LNTDPIRIRIRNTGFLALSNLSKVGRGSKKFFHGVRLLTEICFDILILFSALSVFSIYAESKLFFKICGSGSGIRCLFGPWIRNPGSGIRNRFFPDLGSQIHIFESLVTIFWVKSSIIL
jgi:hypothetical protein